MKTLSVMVQKIMMKVKFSVPKTDILRTQTGQKPDAPEFHSWGIKNGLILTCNKHSRTIILEHMGKALNC